MSVESPSIAERLLDHYDAHARVLPWRVAPGSAARPDPYRVWLSEIMLQQTMVATAIPYFARFTARWPDVGALARADEGEVMAAWAGLGYYARARNLIACARLVAQELDGVFPHTEAGLRALPGVGAYTAAAIAAIAFGRRAVVVDANVERVVARLFAIAAPLPGSKVEIGVRTEGITPDARPGDFAQAMMDLGAATCSPRNPDCAACPLVSGCEAARLGQAEAYPVRAPRRARPRRTGIIWWLERADGHVWLERRDARAMLGGMRGLPGTRWDRMGVQDTAPPLVARWRELPGMVEHVFTHFALGLTVWRARAEGACVPAGDGEWWPIAGLETAGLPSLFVKVARHVAREEITA